MFPADARRGTLITTIIADPKSNPYYGKQKAHSNLLRTSALFCGIKKCVILTHE